MRKRKTKLENKTKRGMFIMWKRRRQLVVPRSTLWMVTGRRIRSGTRMEGTGEAEDADAEADVVVDEASGRKVHRDVSAMEGSTCSVTARIGQR